MHRATRRSASRAPATLAAIAAALLAGACSKGEPDVKPKPNAPLVAPASPVRPADGNATVDETLKERLARQEAAAKMFERNVLAPPPPRAAEPKGPEAKPAAPPAEPKPPEPPPAAAAAKPAPEPSRAAETRAPERKPPEPAPAAAEAPKAASRPTPPRVDVAAAKPSTVDTTPRLLSRVEPDFPPEAFRAGVDRGTVRARITVDRSGNVTQVDILEANPRRYFDRAVQRALAQWKFNEGAPGRTVESEVDFRR